ncbi:Cilia- and flagella-associated protein 54 [Hondaea fermentalgiana]|uniref:Cilia-and flagella-associated protein 54 n=1 Tax=Hondaea fermentalgiana TaxID=2315210 RepID=A0A2R5G788_9STRA|nr:Cilia- and flagella-associated protein 54 [Hondaea fermentalgiana]|eukprot:GBG26395.1 Cilia- and flagella-associated protein 54 [Hondaea fermentalgiana]
MAGAGLSALERFQHTVKEGVERIRNIENFTCTAGAEAANARACAVADIEVAVQHAQRDVVRPKSRAVLATNLMDLGKKLAALGEFKAAVSVGFEPAAVLTQRWRDRAQSKLLAAKTWAQYLEKGFAFGKASPKLPLAQENHVQDIAAKALDFLREVHQEIQTQAKHEELYWLTHNAAQLCLAICEPMVVLGFAEKVHKDALFAILSVEDQLPLCATKFLPLREKLYVLAWTIYESLGNVKAAKDVAHRFGAQLDELRADEMQAEPVPEDILRALDHAQRLVTTATAKFDLMSVQDAHEAETQVPDILRNALGIDLAADTETDSVWLQGPPAAERLESLASMLAISGTRPLRANASAVHDAGAADLSGYVFVLPYLERALGICLDQVLPAKVSIPADNSESARGDDDDDEVDDDEKTKARGKENLDEIKDALSSSSGAPSSSSPSASLPAQACVSLAASLIKFGCFSGAALLLHALARKDVSCSLCQIQAAKLETLRIIALTSMQLRGEGDSDASGHNGTELLTSLGFHETADALLVSGEMAEVEGRLIYVNSIRVLARTLRAHASTLRCADPDLLHDAALFLWSPFCTAMLDTVSSCSPDTPLNPTLIEVTTEVLDCAHFVVLTCDVEDALLRAIIAVRYATFLHTRDVEDSRSALQILRRGLQSLDVQRGELCAADGMASLTAKEKALRGRPSAGTLASLASIHCDMLCLLFEIEFDLAYHEEVAHSRVASSIGAKLRSTEQRLSAEVRHNKYARALLCAVSLSRREQDDYGEKAKILTTAGKLLAEAVAQEESLLQQATSEEHAEGESVIEEKESPVPSLRIVSRTASSIEIKVCPPVKPGKLAPHHYVIYGKTAGSGTEVSTTNTDLVNMGVPFMACKQDPERPFSVFVTDLVPNETYVFAAAAFDEKNQILGGGIGPTTMEVQTLCPLALIECYGVMAVLAFESIRSVVTGSARDFQALHKSIKDQVNVCKQACRAACAYVVSAFVASERPGPLWMREPVDDFWLVREELVAAPQPSLQAFVKATLLLHRLDKDPRTLWKTSASYSSLVRFDVTRSAVDQSAGLCRHIQLLALALHATCGLQDNTLILQTCSRMYNDLQELFALRRPLAGALRAVLAAQFAMRQIPQLMWTEDICTMYAFCSYQILRYTSASQKDSLAHVALLTTDARDETAYGAEDDSENAPQEEDELEDMPEEAWHVTRTMLEKHQVQHALATKMRMELIDTSMAPLKTLAKIHVAIRNNHSFTEPASSDEGTGAGDESTDHSATESHTLGIDEQVLVCLSRARAAASKEKKGALLRHAWGLLAVAGAEETFDYLQLMAMVCRASLGASGCDTANWADEAQHVLWDLDPACAAHARPFVRDVLWEERYENVAPIEATAALAPPLSTTPDPLGIGDIEILQNRMEELLAIANAGVVNSARDDVENGDGEGHDENGEKESSDEASTKENKDEDEVNAEDEEQKVAREAEREAAKTEIDALRSQLDILERRARLLAAAAQTTGSTAPQDAKAQLAMLAEFERIRALCLYKKWLAVDWSLIHAKDAKINFEDPGEGRLVEGVLDEGPRTDLRWLPIKDSASGAVPPTVPRLRPLPNNLSEGDELGEEDEEEDEEGGSSLGDGVDARHSKMSAEAEALTKAHDAAKAAFKEAYEDSPRLLHYLARAMSRARWGQAWRQVEGIGKLMWNVLEFAWITPTQFTEDAVCEAALVPALRTKLQLARQEEANRSTGAESGQNEDGVESDHPEKSGRTGASGDQDGNEDTDGPSLAPKVEAGCYDWRPIFRAGVAIVEMLENCGAQARKRRGSSARSQRFVCDAWWASRMIGFAVQVLCHLKRWPQLIVLGRRFVAAVDNTEALVSQVLPLVVLAQSNLSQAADAEAQRVRGALEACVASWQESQRKKKRRKPARKAPSSATEAPLSDAEQAYLAEKSALESSLAACESRLEQLKTMELEVARMQQNLTRDKSTSAEALETAQALGKRALLQFLTPESEGLALLAPVPGLGTRRTRTQRTQRSPRSVVSKSSRFSRRTRLNDGASVLSKFTNEPEADPDAELGLSGASVKEAIQAYVKAVQIMRQKQETTLLAQALLELGNLHAAQGGVAGWAAARTAWTDAVDAVLQDVNSVSSWERILESAAKTPTSVSKWTPKENLASCAELTMCQSLLARFGARACVLAATSCAKLAQFSFTGDVDKTMKHLRLGGWLFACLLSASIEHPVRTCDYASYQVRELMPGLDRALFNFQAVRKTAILEALGHIARELSRSSRQADNLLSLPIASLLEYAGRQWCLSASVVLESHLIRSTALTQLGLVRESGLALRAVLLGANFPVDESELLRSSAELHQASSVADEPQDADEVLAILQMQREAHGVQFALTSNEAPWSRANRDGLRSLVTLGPETEPIPWVSKALGPRLMEILRVCRARLVCRVLSFWPPSTRVESEGEEDASLSRNELLEATLKLLNPQLPEVFAQELTGKETEPDADGAETLVSSRDSMLQIAKASSAEVLTCAADVLLAQGKARTTIRWASICLEALASSRAVGDTASNDVDADSPRLNIHAWLHLRFSLLRAAELLGSPESVLAASHSLDHDCEVNAESDIRRAAIVCSAEALARLGSLQEAARVAHTAIIASAEVRDLTYVKAIVIAKQAHAAWIRCSNQQASEAESGESDDIEEASIRAAYTSAQAALGAIGFFEPKKTSPRTKQTLYTDIIAAYAIVARYHAEEERSCGILQDALDTVAVSLIPLPWLKSEAMLLNALLQESTVEAEAEVEKALVACAELACEAQGATLDLGRRACTRLGAAAGASQWLRAAECLGSGFARLGAQLSEFARGASSVADTEEASLRAREMDPFFADTFAQEVGLQGLICRLQREIFGRSVGLDLERHERIRALYAYLSAADDSFRESFMVAATVLPVRDDASPEDDGGEISVPDGLVAAQWVRDKAVDAKNVDLILLRPGRAVPIRKSMPFASVREVRDDLSHAKRMNDSSLLGAAIRQAMVLLGVGSEDEDGVSDDELNGISESNQEELATWLERLFDVRSGTFIEDAGEEFRSILHQVREDDKSAATQ